MRGKERLASAVKLIIVWVLLVVTCSFCGLVASFFSVCVTVAKGYTEQATVGIISYKGFPVWFTMAADGMGFAGRFNFGRFQANWTVWALFFTLVCCGLRIALRKSRNKK